MDRRSRRRSRSPIRRRDKKSEAERVRNRMQASLNSATASVCREDNDTTSSTKARASDRGTASELTFSERFDRQRQIERIEADGFVPGTYTSGQSNTDREVDPALKKHDDAMFGAQWKSKEISKKLSQKSTSNPQPRVSAAEIAAIPLPPPTLDDCPIAVQWLSLPDSERRQQWKKTFLQQRKDLFEGVL